MNKKKLFFIVAFLFAVFAGSAQTSGDTLKVLKNCISIAELQKEYPLTLDNKTKVVYILQHGVSFNNVDDIKIDGYELIFMTKEEIKENEIENYFLFWTFIISQQDGAFIEYTYNTKDKYLKIESKMNFAQNNWIIQNNNVKEVNNAN